MSQYGADAFGSPKPGYEYQLECLGMPRRCTRVLVPKKPELPRTFCYTKGPDGEGTYKLATCKGYTKNCRRTKRTMYHVKYHGERKDDKVYLCEYVANRRRLSKPEIKSCEPGESYSFCSAHCENTCSLTRKHCTRICRSGCKCIAGYVRDETTGYCIPPSYCPKEKL